MDRPALSTVAELLKPITWFPPMWAFTCGVVASGVSIREVWPVVLLGVLLAGPLVCATSQAVNDWFDRHVDAINEPGRPIPSGRMPGRWGLYIAVAWTALSMAVASLLGPWGFGAAIAGLALAWAYSAPPVRLKENGWWGNAACGLCYEGLAWVTGAAVMAGGAMPDARSLALAGLYSLGAQLGVDRAARVACWTMAVPQVGVVALLLAWAQPWHALAVIGLLLVQLAMMRWFVAAPSRRALPYSGFGVPLFVAGMMVSAFALRAGGAA